MGPAVSAPAPPPGAGGGAGVGCCSLMHLSEDNARFLLLAVVMVIYMVAGAGLFQYLEEESELRAGRDFRRMYRDFQRRLENCTVDMVGVRELLNAYGKAKVAGSLGRRRRWDFPGSFHFVGTIVSTIGYGSTAPQTTAGKAVVILYGFLGCSGGILFFNLFLERIITFLAYILRSVHLRKLAKQRAADARASTGENGPAARRDSRATLDDYDEDSSLDNWKPSVYWVMLCLVLASTTVASCASALYSPYEGWTFFESVYFCFVSFATIGFGDYVSTQSEKYPHVHLYRFANFIFLVLGCCCIYSLFNVTSIVIKQALNWMIFRLDCQCTRQAGMAANRLWRRHSQRLRRRSMRRASATSGRRRSSVAKPGTLRRQRRPLALGTVRNTLPVCGINADAVAKANPDVDDSDSYDSDGERRMSGEMISMKDFLQANKVSLAVMQKQLYETAQMQRGYGYSQPPKPASGSFTPGTVGPLAIVAQKLGENST
ncbi:potassium channel subfamily K member 13-like [Ischnura elegans]|uniref:potassium channel subfamily K member 13-like n=1 Tax=Ischnura elegans TaxID=197161 RepID=UPI001ED893FF|nr:potassium channel subfamily K member 13-like [Ischnura elegans]